MVLLTVLALAGCGGSGSDETDEGDGEEETAGGEGEETTEEEDAELSVEEAFLDELPAGAREEVMVSCERQAEGAWRLTCSLAVAGREAIGHSGDLLARERVAVPVLRALESMFRDRRLSRWMRLRTLYEIGHVYEHLARVARRQERRTARAVPEQPDEEAGEEASEEEASESDEGADAPDDETPDPDEGAPELEPRESELLECLAAVRYLVLVRAARTHRIEAGFVTRATTVLRSIGDERLVTCAEDAREHDPVFEAYRPGELDEPPPPPEEDAEQSSGEDEAGDEG